LTLTWQAGKHHSHVFLGKDIHHLVSFSVSIFPIPLAHLCPSRSLLSIIGTTKDVTPSLDSCQLKRGSPQGVFSSYDAFALYHVKSAHGIGASRSLRYATKRSRLVISSLKSTSPPMFGRGDTSPLFSPFDAGIDMSHENGARRQTPRNRMLSPHGW
jgi:hypothetical protein